MKTALLIPAVAAVLCAASPALACRVAPASVRAEAALPSVGFTAVVSSNTRSRTPEGEETIMVVLDLDETLAGSPPAQTALSGVLSEEIVITSCGPIRPYPYQFTELSEGSTVVVFGVQSADAGLIVQSVALADSARGRSLLEILRRS